MLNRKQGQQVGQLSHVHLSLHFLSLSISVLSICVLSCQLSGDVIKRWHDLPIGLALSSLHLSFSWLLNPKGPNLSFDLQGYEMPLNLHVCMRVSKREERPMARPPALKDTFVIGGQSF